MRHTHSHHDDADLRAYYVEQLCTIALCGALGGVSVLMWQRGMLDYILAVPFHLFVLLGGIVLLALVAIKAVTLWLSVGQPQSAHYYVHDHDHSHGHDHDHDHDCDPEHHHEHGTTTADVQDGAVMHGHSHDHDHDHDHDHGHSHGWNPWRYALLLLPIVLFFLNLPNEALGENYILRQLPKVQLADDGLIPMPVKPEPPEVVPLPSLIDHGYSAAARQAWDGRIVKVAGQFVPGDSPQQFTVARLRIICCAADVGVLWTRVIAPESIVGFNAMEWIDVEGQLQYRKTSDGKRYVPVIQLRSDQDVRRVDPPANPYLQ